MIEDASGLLMALYALTPAAELAPEEPPAPAPPAPPPPEPPAAAPPRRRRQAAQASAKAGGAGGSRQPGPTASTIVPGGTLAFYESNGNFVAYCARHDGCVVTRKSKASSSSSTEPPKAYRPVGFMANWLGLHYLCEHKEEHWDDMMFAQAALDEEAGRALVRASLGGPDLLTHE